MINSTPAILRNSPEGIIVPNKPADAPRAVKTNEKPAMKLMVWRTTYLRLGGLVVRAELPATVAIYIGTRGKIQGERKDNTPAANAMGSVIFVTYKFTFFILCLVFFNALTNYTRVSYVYA